MISDGNKTTENMGERKETPKIAYFFNSFFFMNEIGGAKMLERDSPEKKKSRVVKLGFMSLGLMKEGKIVTNPLNK